jgi:hypothetical protein
MWWWMDATLVGFLPMVCKVDLRIVGRLKCSLSWLSPVHSSLFRKWLGLPVWSVVRLFVGQGSSNSRDITLAGQLHYTSHMCRSYSRSDAVFRIRPWNKLSRAPCTYSSYVQIKSKPAQFNPAEPKPTVNFQFRCVSRASACLPPCLSSLYSVCFRVKSFSATCWT